MFNKYTSRAFTLIELIITIVIIGILAAVAVVGYSTVVDRSETAAAETTLRSIDREYRALDAFNIPADGSVGVAIDDMTPIDGVNFEAADANNNGLLESEEVVQFAGSSLSLRSASIPGVIGEGDGGGSTNVVTPIVPFQVSYDQQSFSTAGSSELLAPTVLGADGTVTYSYTGDLPAEVSFDTATGEFTGPATWNETATAVTAGGNHSCALLSDGTVECWGKSTLTTVPSSVMNATVTAVDAGSNHTCALLSDGTVECWGSSSFNQLSVPSSLANAIAIDATNIITCALRSGGTVKCWGWDNYGRVSGPSSATNATAVAAGGNHSCVAHSDGTVTCWGQDTYGQVSGAASIANATAVTAGNFHNCALLSDGTVTCWGSDGSGRSSVPASVVNATAVDAGGAHTCAVHSGGTVECWGWDNYGQATVPSSVVNATAVSADLYHTCALLSGGTVECWGRDSEGQLTPPTIGNDGFPATIEIQATDGTNTATLTVELTVS